jgi:hypothetical protein
MARIAVVVAAVTGLVPQSPPIPSARWSVHVSVVDEKASPRPICRRPTSRFGTKETEGRLKRSCYTCPGARWSCFSTPAPAWADRPMR